MSAQLSPLEQLEQQSQQQQTPQAPSAVSPLEQLEQMHSDPAQASGDQGFLSGIYNSTVKPAAQSVANDFNNSVGAAYSEAAQHVKNGEYAKAAGSLLSVFDKGGDNVINAFHGLLDMHKAEIQKSIAMAKAGRYSEAAGHGLAAAVPALGPAAAKAGEDIGSGKTGEGLGEAAGTIGTALLPEVGRQVGKGAAALKAVVTPVADSVNESLQSGIRDVASNVASDTKLPATAIEENVPVRQTFEKLADNVQAQSKDLYAQIDNATGGRLTNLQDKLRNIETKMRGLTGVEEVDGAAEDRLTAQKDALNTQIDEVMQQATENGVDPSVADNARAAWRQQSALRDVDQQLKMSTFGNAKQAAEVVDPSKLVSRLQKLSDSGRLEEALGEENADKLLQQAYDSLQQSKDTAEQNATVAARRGAIKGAAIKTVATGAGIGAGGSVIAHVLGGKK